MRYNSIRKERRRLYIPSCIYWPFIQCLKTTKPRGSVVVLCPRTTAPNHIPISNRKSCKMYENLSFLQKKGLSNERMQWIFWSPQSAKIFGIFKKKSHWVSVVRGYVHCKLSPICHLFFDRDPWFTWSKESQIRYIISNLGFIIFYNFYKTGSFFM